MIDTDKIVENLFRRHVPIVDIAKGVELTVAQVTDIIMKKGLDWQNCNVIRDRNICDDYLNGIKITELADKYKIERHGITNILRKQGVYQNRFASYDTDEKQKRNNQIVSLYEEGNSISEVARAMNMHRSTVAKVLKVLEIQMRPQHQTGHSKGVSRNVKYQYDRNFFEQIDTEDKAYWLGFLYADGYTHPRQGLVLTIARKDLNHLLKLRHALNADDVPITSHIRCIKI